MAKIVTNNQEMIEFKPKKDFFVGIDSDGCVFDAMEIKHKECFIPNTINAWRLQTVSRYAREVHEFVNLYSKWRGLNRWKNIVRTMDMLREHPEVKRRGFEVMQLDGMTYYKVIAPNFPMYEKAFKNLQEYSLSETEADDEENGKLKAWTKLHSAYKNIEPLAINITPVPSVPEKLTYESVPVRAEAQARHALLNHYLSVISGGAQIPPFLLMRYMDKALGMLVSDEGKASLGRKKLELMNILPDLNADDKVVYGITTDNKTFQTDENPT